MTVLVVTLLAWPVLAQKPGDPSPEPPPDGPISARLIAKETTYILDRQGMTAEQYAKAITAGKVDPPEVDLVLELKNTTKEDVRLRVTGAAPKLVLILKGKGKVIDRKAVRSEKQKLTYIELKPGEVHKIPLKKLAGYTSSTQEMQSFWTEPGEYTLSVEYTTYTQTAVAAPVGGGLPGGGGLATRTTKLAPITSSSVKLTVKLK
jgi:hypothetical protein